MRQGCVAPTQHGATLRQFAAAKEIVQQQLENAKMRKIAVQCPMFNAQCKIPVEWPYIPHCNGTRIR